MSVYFWGIIKNNQVFSGEQNWTFRRIDDESFVQVDEHKLEE